MLGYVAIVHIYFYIFNFFLFFHSRQEEACKDKIFHSKTLRRLTLRGVRLRAVLVTFGSSEHLIADSAQC